MRYTLFLRELLSDYHHNPDSLASRCQVLAEASASLSRRYRDSEEPVFFEPESNGSFWGFSEEPSSYWLFPKAGLQVNEYNYRILDILFEIRGDREGYPSTFRVLRPAKLIPILLEGTEYLEHEARGILEFEGDTPSMGIGEKLIHLQSRFEELERFARVSFAENRQPFSPPQPLAVPLDTGDNPSEDEVQAQELPNLNDEAQEASALPDEPRYFSESEIFTDELYFIDQENALPGSLLPKIDGTPIYYKGRRITLLIPLKPQLLKYCTPEALIGTANQQGIVKIKSLNKDKIGITLEWPLSETNASSPTVYPCCTWYDLKRENALSQIPKLELFPNAKADTCQQYYVLAVDESNQFRVKIPNAIAEYRESLNGKSYHLTILNKFPLLIECFNEQNVFLGLILLETPLKTVELIEGWRESLKLQVTDSKKLKEGLSIDEYLLWWIISSSRISASIPETST